VEIRLDGGGARIASALDGKPYNDAAYDCVNSLLLNESPGFTAYFNASLAKALQQAVDERREQPSDWEDD
jgi:hypothetical protein